jgi:hypothetical protein
MLQFKRVEPVQVTEEHRLDSFSAKTKAYLRKFLGAHDADKIWLQGQKIADLYERALFYRQMVLACERQLCGGEIKDELTDFTIYKHQPVGFREFCCSPQYLNKEQEIYPVVLAAGEELNSGNYIEAVCTGGIGSGKTTLALYTNAYQVYRLSCMRNPHRLYGLDPSSEILFIFQSINKTLAKGVDYQRFRDMIQGSPYFRQHFPFNKGLESKLVFPNRIEVMPVAGTETAAIGQNVIGGLIDELNYMAVVEKSKAAVDKGAYDQAIQVYNSIARRRKSRFQAAGKLPGILCLVSSKKYPGQFTDQKMDEAKKDPTIYVYDKRVWDIKPTSFGSKGWFHVFAGDMTRKPRIIEPNENVPDQDRASIVSVPTEFRLDFEKDIINALREIAGVSTLARHPFFMETDKVSRAFKRYPSIFSQSPVDFVETRLTLVKGAFFKPELPRFAHGDLAITGDSAGLAIGCVYDFMNVGGIGQVAWMPKIHMDGVLEIRAPKNAEILFFKVREVITTLRKMGLNIRWVTFDQFQSTDSQQILRQQGLITGHQSIDNVPCMPYEFCKAAMYDGRLRVPEDQHLLKEILQLEKDAKTGKIDHPPVGSKDCADGLAGVVFGLTQRREIWGQFGIPISMIPSSVVDSRDVMAQKNMEKQPDYQESYTEEDRVRRRLA